MDYAGVGEEGEGVQDIGHAGAASRGSETKRTQRLHDGAQLALVDPLAAVFVLKRREALRGMAGLLRLTCCSRCSRLHSHSGNTISTRDCSLMTARSIGEEAKR